MNLDIVWPVITLVALTAAVWCRMYVVRIGEMRRRHIDPQALATSSAKATALEDVAPADNFRNLFEVPVLFYMLCALLLSTGSVTPLQLALAWTFVVLRIAHSGIHLSYNRVMHRFIVYVLGSLCVFTMWAVFALQMATSL